VLQIRLVDVERDAPVGSASGQLCRLSDISCSDPLMQVESDSDGLIETSSPGGFEGYLQLTAAGFVPVLYFVPSVIFGEVEVPMPLPSLLEELARKLEVELDSERGHVLLRAEDCFGEVAADVAFSSPQADAGTTRFVAVDNNVSSRAEATTELGLGGFLNFSAVTPAIHAYLRTTDERLQTMSLVVRPGHVTVAAVQP